MCICVHIHTYICIYIHMHIHTYTYTHAHRRTIWPKLSEHGYISGCWWLHTYICIYIHTYIHIDGQSDLSSQSMVISAGADGFIHTYAYTYIHTYIHIDGQSDLSSQSMVISAGADGFIHFWDLVFGQHAFKIQVLRYIHLQNVACTSLESCVYVNVRIYTFLGSCLRAACVQNTHFSLASPYWEWSKFHKFDHWTNNQVFKPTKASFGVVKMSIDHTMSFLACGDVAGWVSILDVSGLQTKREPESVISLYKVCMYVCMYVCKRAAG